MGRFNIVNGEDNSKSIERTKNTNKQTLFSLFFQSTSVGLNFLLIPVTISFLNQELYGIWVTLLSIISWISIMDLGIGLGLRNRLAEAIAKNELNSARQYVSTAYISISVIMLPILIVGLFVISFLNWNSIFNISTVKNVDLVFSVSIMLIGMIGVFILGLINQVFNGIQKNAFVALHPIILNTVILLVLKFKPHYASGLVFMSSLYVIVSLVTLTIITIVVFKKHKYLIPNINYFDKTKVRFLLSIGLKFFIIQIATVVIFSTDNVIITQVLGPKEVTSYQITRQVFGILSMISGLIMGPLWSAYTDAYIKGDINWIKNVINKLLILMIPLLLSVAVLILYFKNILSIWMNQDLHISDQLVFFMGIYTIITIWNNIFGFVLGGIGKIRLSTYTTVFAMLVNIPLSIYLAHKIGVSGVILGTTLSIMISSILSPVQTYFFIFTEKKSSLFTSMLS